MQGSQVDRPTDRHVGGYRKGVGAGVEVKAGQCQAVSLVTCQPNYVVFVCMEEGRGLAREAAA